MRKLLSGQKIAHSSSLTVEAGHEGPRAGLKRTTTLASASNPLDCRVTGCIRGGEHSQMAHGLQSASASACAAKIHLLIGEVTRGALCTRYRKGGCCSTGPHSRHPIARHCLRSVSQVQGSLQHRTSLRRRSCNNLPLHLPSPHHLPSFLHPPRPLPAPTVSFR